MAKTKTPFLSMGASGSVGGSITAQRRSGATLIREKPLPTDPYSLAQAYQRWLYEDYAYLWRQQSVSTQRAYAAAGGRFHLTGFQYWMKYNLKNLPDIIAGWRLDRGADVLAPDFSRNANTGTTFGASPASGLIAQALSFDGLNDYIDCGNNPLLNLPGLVVTIEAFIKTSTVVHNDLLFKTGGGPYWLFRVQGTGETFIQFWDGAAQMRVYSTALVNDGKWHHIASVLENNVQAKAYVDGIECSVSAIIVALSPFAPAATMKIGHNAISGNWFAGQADHIVMYNRILDPTEILRHSERRYAL